MMACFGWRRARRRLVRMVAVARVETLRLIHDPMTISLILLVPTIQIVLFGYAVNLDPRHVPIAIAGDRDGRAAQVLSTIESTGYFAVLADGLEPGAAKLLVEKGKALVGIELSSRIGSLDDALSGDAKVFVDATEPAAVRPALGSLESAYWKRIAQFYAIGPVPAVKIEWLYNPAGSMAWAIVPGLVGVVVMISMLILGALTLVRERELGSWETLLATPVDAIDAMAGKLSPYVIIGTAQAGIMVYLAQVLFDVPVTGSLWALMLAAPLYAFAHLILGFAFSALAESQMQAIQAAVFFYLPSMLLSGFIFPFLGMPRWAQAIGSILPLTHFVRATRAVLLRGAGASVVLTEMVPVALFALATAMLALAAYRRRID